MPFTKKLFQFNRKYLGGSLIFICISTICVAFSMSDNDDYEFARREILLRRVGHEILLQAGDSISRVLPVKKISKNEYQLSFEHAFAFQTELLVKVTQHLLAKDPLASDYVVNVLNCTDAQVVYGYAVSKDKKDDIITCKGRKQPTGCYMINVTFKPKGIVTAKNGYVLGSFAALAFVGFFLLIPAKSQKTLTDSNPTDSPIDLIDGVVTLGTLLFDTEARKLVANGNTIELTKTETRVLRIFALAPNQAIERSRLQKEIWEDDGVIVGRSLDMFISKLRKKLELDPNIKIVVIRGKGYKLVVGN